jgi:hypothetical protein
MNDPYDEILSQQETQQVSYWESLEDPDENLDLPENDPLLW